MVSMDVTLRSILDTGAAVGWADGHTVLVDRPAGRAGGSGLGFNGAQLLALAAGGCFCNDLRYAADELGVELGTIAIDVTIDLDGEPLLATHIKLHVACDMLDGSSPQNLIEHARKTCMVSNSLPRGIAVDVIAKEQAG